MVEAYELVIELSSKAKLGNVPTRKAAESWIAPSFVGYDMDIDVLSLDERKIRVKMAFKINTGSISENVFDMIVESFVNDLVRSINAFIAGFDTFDAKWELWEL